MKRWLIASAVLTTLSLAAAAVIAFPLRNTLMENIPTHWNFEMAPDAWTPREKIFPVLLIFPGVMALVTLLQWAIPLISPKQFDVVRFGDTFGYIMTMLVAFFGFILCLQTWAAIEDSPYYGRAFVASFFVMFALLGNQLGKVRRNAFMGVRTPWTLASEKVWDATHRHAAWLWFALGVIGALAVLLGVPGWIAMVALIVSALWPVVYSYVVFRRLKSTNQIDDALPE